MNGPGLAMHELLEAVDGLVLVVDATSLRALRVAGQPALLGASSEELLADPVALGTRVNPEDGARWRALLGDTARDGQPRRFDLRLAAGNRFVRASVRRLASGHLGVTLVLLGDPLAAHGCEQVLARLPIIVYRLDAAGSYVSVAGGGMIRPPEEMLGRSAFERYRGLQTRLDSGEVIDAADGLRRCLAGESLSGIVRYGDLYFTYRIEPLRDEHGAIVGAVGVSQDVTAREREREALARAEQQLRGRTAELEAIFEAQPDLYFRVDRDGRLLDYQAGRTTFLYVPPEVFLGKRVSEVLPPTVGPGFEAAVREALDAGVITSFEYELETPEGLGTFEARNVPLEQRGEVSIVVRNITERRRAEAERAILLERERAARAAAEEAVRARDEFLSVASHELRTPFTSLQLAVQSLLRFGGEAPPLPYLRRVLDIAERQSRRLSGLLDTLLDVSRIHAGRLEADRREVDLSALVTEAVERFRQGLPDPGPAIRVLAPAPVIACVDPSAIEQVLVNLLSNAVKYGAGRPVEVRVAERDGAAVLSVADQGIGIPIDRQPHVFERFERAVSARHFGGLGLGLYIARSLVETHGGRIAVESAPDQGSTFTVTLPRRS